VNRASTEEQTVKVQVRQLHLGSRFVLVTFTNDQTVPQWIAKQRSFAETSDGSYFDIEPQAKYLGIQVKRIPYKPEEMLVIDPGKTLAFEVDIDELYDLGPVNSARKLRYSAYQPVEGTAQMVPISSDWISLP
jgi:hypothetical protein